MTAEAIAQLAWDQRAERTPDRTIRDVLGPGDFRRAEWRARYLEVVGMYCRLYREHENRAGECAVCHAPIAGRGHIYCSRACQDASRVRDIECAHCTASFRGRPGSRYCSRRCSQLARRKREERACVECGQSFYAKPSHRDRVVTCSPACASAHKSKPEQQKRAA